MRRPARRPRQPPGHSPAPGRGERGEGWGGGGEARGAGVLEPSQPVRRGTVRRSGAGPGPAPHRRRGGGGGGTPGGARAQLAARGTAEERPGAGQRGPALPGPGPGLGPGPVPLPPSITQGRRGRTCPAAGGPRPCQLPGRPRGTAAVLRPARPRPGLLHRPRERARGEPATPDHRGRGGQPPPARPATGPAAKGERSAAAGPVCLPRSAAPNFNVYCKLGVAPSGLGEAEGNAIPSSYLRDARRAERLLRAEDDLCPRSCPEPEPELVPVPPLSQTALRGVATKNLNIRSKE